MNIFVGELDMAFIVLISPIIAETKSVDDWGVKYFRGIPKSSWVVEIQSLLKKDYVEMRKKLNAIKVFKQMPVAWKEEFTFSFGDS